MIASDALSVRVRGEGAESVPTDHTNLVWKAAEMLAAEAGIAPDVEISIVKGIPWRAAWRRQRRRGGSAGRAQRTVAARARSGRPSVFAARLGSDVPFSLHGGTAVGTGRGEKLLPVLSRDSFHWVLALARVTVDADGVP